MKKNVHHNKPLTLGEKGNSLMSLLAVIITAFILFKFLLVAFFLTGKSEAKFNEDILAYFVLSSDLSVFFTRPWTILTQNWIHTHTLLFIGNMLWLAAFGYITQDVGKKYTLIPNYIISGFLAAIVFLIVSAATHTPVSLLYGSSAGILAIITTLIINAPRYKIFPMIGGGLPVWILGVIFIITKAAQAYVLPIPEIAALLTGIIWGVWYGLQIKKGKDPGRFIHQFFYTIENLFNPDKNKEEEKATREYFYNVDQRKPFEKFPHITQKRIDEILDKINQQGYRYLTDEEKKLLKRAADEEDI